MIGIDTNMIVRYLTRDDEGQYERAREVLQSHCTAENPGFIHPIVLCEIAWVLKAAYGRTREEIYTVVNMLLQARQIAIGNRDAVRAALSDHQNSSADFADCLIARLNEECGCETTITFDRRAAGVRGFSLA